MSAAQGAHSAVLAGCRLQPHEVVTAVPPPTRCPGKPLTEYGRLPCHMRWQRHMSGLRCHLSTSSKDLFLMQWLLHQCVVPDDALTKCGPLHWLDVRP